VSAVRNPQSRDQFLADEPAVCSKPAASSEAESHVSQVEFTERGVVGECLQGGACLDLNALTSSFVADQGLGSKSSLHGLYIVALSNVTKGF
jgi:hypothetical protein